MKYHNITYDDMLNGDGLRVVLWVSGCEHHCKGCQNPVTWNPEDGLEFDLFTLYELFAELSKEHVSGITFSGGDPLHPNNRTAIYNVISIIKENFPNKTIWVYTGYTWEEILKLDLTYIIEYADVLVDGKYCSALNDKNAHWVGSTNQRVIDIKKSLMEGEVVSHERN